jgi:putative transposase
VRALQANGVSQRRACQLVDCTRSTLHYHRQRPNDEPIATRMRELAAERPRWGWRRLKVLFEREGITIGFDRFLRIYRENGLQVRPRRKRKANYVRGNVVPPVSRPNERWSIDFMHDRLSNGRKIRTLNIVDDFTRECLALRVAFSFGSADVIREFEAIAFERGLPETIRFDNGSEFTSLAMLRWSGERGVRTHFIAPGKPTQNANIESLNGKIRDELLNMHAFTNIFEARRAAEAWRADYNEVRPHSALGLLTPREFVQSLKTNSPSQLSAA